MQRREWTRSFCRPIGQVLRLESRSKSDQPSLGGRPHVVTRQPFFSSERGDRAVEELIQSMLCRDPKAAFTIFEQGENILLRKAILITEIVEVLIGIATNAVLRADPQLTVLSIYQGQDDASDEAVRIHVKAFVVSCETQRTAECPDPDTVVAADHRIDVGTGRDGAKGL